MDIVLCPGLIHSASWRPTRAGALVVSRALEEEKGGLKGKKDGLQIVQGGGIHGVRAVSTPNMTAAGQNTAEITS